MNSSTTTVRPASPNAPSSRQSATARSASSRLAQTMAPLPAARPSVLTTTGAPSSRQYARAASARVKTRKAAVGIPWRAIRSFAKTFELSILAAAWLGPKTDMPAARSRSARPRASGNSGPTTTRSGRSRRASATSSSTAPSFTGAQSACAAMPGFPGAATRAPRRGLCASFHASACSRPPPPTSSTFTRRPPRTPLHPPDGSGRSAPTGCRGRARDSGASVGPPTHCGRACRARRRG